MPTSTMFAFASDQAFQGNISFLGHPIRMALLGAGTQPSLKWTCYDDVEGELKGTRGYVRGGETLESKTRTEDGYRILWSSAEVVWPEVTLSTAYGVLYDAYGVRPLICLVDFGRTLSPVNGPLTVTPNPAWFATSI